MTSKLSLLAGLWLLTVSAFADSSQTSKTNAPEISLAQLAAKPASPVEGDGWRPLFDGKSLAGWVVTDFAGHGAVTCESGLVVIGEGDSLTGINYTNEVPKVNYEVTLEAMKLQGSDFFCGLTFPVGDSYASLIVGGWGGTVTGISSVDDADASENETTQFKKYEVDQWYRVRVGVTATKIQAWVGQEKLVDLTTTGKKIGLRFGEIENSKPLGVAAYQTRAALRGIQIRRLEMKAEK